MPEHSPLEIVQTLARQRDVAGSNPLTIIATLAGTPGTTISHLPINGALTHAWVQVIGEAFRPHQAQAVSSLRRGDPFVLQGAAPFTHRSMHLLTLEHMLAKPHTTALLLAPDEAAAAQQIASIRALAAPIQGRVRASHVTATTAAREAAYHNLLALAPHTLHSRLLQHHERGWRPFWERLGMVVLPDMERYSGVAAAHLGGLLLRVLRLAPADTFPVLLATLANLPDAHTTLDRLTGLSWRIIAATDGATPATTFAVWRAGHEQLPATVTLATTLQRTGYHTHIVAHPLDSARLADDLPSGTPAVSLGDTVQPADAVLCCGLPEATVTLHAAATSGTRLVVLVAGTHPTEQTIARQTLQPNPAWHTPPLNAYVEAFHLLCAASESPLALDEVAAWQADAIVSHLYEKGKLNRMPDADAAWHPHPKAHDPYVPFSLHAVSEPAVVLHDQHATPLATLDPASFNRWGHPDAALPPLRGGYRVTASDDAPLSLTLRAEPQPRRTLPRRQCTVQLRQQDTRASRNLSLRRAVPIAWGRVLADEEVIGYRVAVPDHSAAHQSLKQPLTASWTAPACWIELPLRVKATDQMIGWCVVLAVHLLSTASMRDLVPAYDAGVTRLYLIDAQPGGSGVAHWLYDHAEQVLPLAYDIALDARHDALLEPVARLDMDWLLPLLGGESEPARAPVAPVAVEVVTEHQPTAQPHAAAPPPAPRPPKPPGGVPRLNKPPTPPPAQTEPDLTPPAQPEPPPAHDAPAPKRSSSGKRTSRRKQSEPPADAPQPADTPPPAQSPEEAAPAQMELTPPDPEAILQRLQSIRAQQEPPTPRRNTKRGKPKTSDAPPAEPRYQPGDEVLCVPYGAGTVQAAWIDTDDEQERLRVAFTEHGELEINPAVNSVRRVPPPTPPIDDDTGT